MPTCATVASTSADTCVELHTLPDRQRVFAVEVTARDEPATSPAARSPISAASRRSQRPHRRPRRVRRDGPRDHPQPHARRVTWPPRASRADVVACTDRASGMASLFFNGDDDARGAPVAVAPTAMGDPWRPLGMGFVGIAFASPRVTVLDTSPAPSRPTDTRGGQPDPPGGGDRRRRHRPSPSVQLFVDSVAPTVSIVTCGSPSPWAPTDHRAMSDIDATSDVPGDAHAHARRGCRPRSPDGASFIAGRGRFMAVRFRREHHDARPIFGHRPGAGNATTTTAPWHGGGRQPARRCRSRRRRQTRSSRPLAATNDHAALRRARRHG